MSLSEPTIAALQALMAQDKELMAQVKTTKDAAQAASLIAAAAASNGMTVSEVDLTAYFAQASQAAVNQALSDAQLEAVAGGFLQDEGAGFVFLSVFTFGIGCAAVSISQATGSGGIGFLKKYC